MEEKIKGLVNEVFDYFDGDKPMTRLFLHNRIKKLIDFKYSNLNDRQNKILEDSQRDSIPVFILTAKDVLSLPVLRDYLEICKKFRCSEEFVDQLTKVLEDYMGWREDYPSQVKLPD
jgi:hypothetical protein